MKKTVTLTLASTLVLGLMAGCATTQSGSQSAGAADTSLADATKHTVETTETRNFSDEMKIPYAVDLSPEDGSDSVERQGDHADSIYFAHPDFYNMESTDTLTILTNFQTIQQTSEWSCGVACVLMTLTGTTGWETGTRSLWPPCATPWTAPNWRGTPAPHWCRRWTCWTESAALHTLLL